MSSHTHAVPLGPPEQALGFRARWAARTPHPRPGLAGLAAGGLAFGAAAVMLGALAGPADSSPLTVIGRASAAALPIGIGVFAMGAPASRRFGAALVLAGILGAGASLQGSAEPVLYSAGRLFSWALEVLLVWTVLAFPTGRLAARTDRVLVACAVAMTAVLYLPTALIVESFPVPAPWGSCVEACPPNAFQVVGEPGWLASVVQPLREAAAGLLLLAVTLRLAGRLYSASALLRKALAPVVVVSVLRCLVLPTALAARELAPGSEAGAVGSWLLVLALPGLALAYLIGLLSWRLFIAEAMQQIAVRVAGQRTPQDLGDAIGEALHDPSFEVVYRDRFCESQWADASGRGVWLPAAGSRLMVSEVRGPDGEVVAAVVHDRVLEAERDLIEAVAAYATTALENHRLRERTEHLLADVRESRARILEAADTERRKLERNLHDGAQQRLVALGIRLEVAAGLLPPEQAGVADVLRELKDEVEATLDEVRGLARGIYPPLLVDRGLVEALRSAALRMPLPVAVEAEGVGRYPQQQETAVYFCCLEALQNVAKHSGATAARIHLWDDGELNFEVSDEGAGFEAARVRRGQGTTNMHDRIAAIDGELVIESAPGRGTRIRGAVPLGAGARRGVVAQS